jgi:hypothetical protein
MLGATVDRLSTFALRSVIILALCALGACGGGTSGTDGDHEYKILGSLSTASGEAVPAATVSVLETGDNALSDSAGIFVLRTRTGASTLTLLVENQGQEARTQLTSLPAEDSAIEISLSFDPQAGSVAIVSVSAQPLTEQAAPSPSAQSSTPAPAQSPSTEKKNPGKEKQVPEEPAAPQKSLLRGKVIDPLGVPVADVSIRALGHGTTSSNTNGVFQLRYPVGTASLSLVVNFRGFESKLKLNKLPKEPAQVNLVIRMTLIADKGKPSVNKFGDIRRIDIAVQSITHAKLD